MDGEFPPPPPDAFDPCFPMGVFLRGELVELDSTLAAFRGVNGATLTLPGDPTPLVTTPPNGRLDTCVPPSEPLRFDVHAPTGFLGGSLVMPRDTLQSLRFLSFRSMTTARAASFYSERGLAFDATKAHVLVFLSSDVTTVTLDRPHGAAQAGNDGVQPGTFVWSASSTGRYVLFPNVDVSQPTGRVDAGPSLSVPLVAGELTLAAISVVFL
ncbi:MAG: hypothetical protein KF773_13995 [Deltaproteobacteria bacterium]|nr:hypothetical protein [Deltaproteobacteria bacterium]MCW5802316.1 hypothetical protein [Deltaproteobacteria bacterium]